MLSDAGYATGLFGKWHLGTHEKDDSRPIRDSTSGMASPTRLTRACGPSSRSSTSVVERKAQSDTPCRNMSMNGKKGSDSQETEGLRQCRTRPEIDRADVPIARRTFIRRHAQTGREPFFAVSALHADAHAGCAEQGVRGDKSGNGDWGDVLMQIDAYVGRTSRRALTNWGSADNTIFIFTVRQWTGDACPDINGWSGPWRGSYFSRLWRGSLRVPFIMRWPGNGPGWGG